MSKLETSAYGRSRRCSFPKRLKKREEVRASTSSKDDRRVKTEEEDTKEEEAESQAKTSNSVKIVETPEHGFISEVGDPARCSTPLEEEDLNLSESEDSSLIIEYTSSEED